MYFTNVVYVSSQMIEKMFILYQKTNVFKSIHLYKHNEVLFGTMLNRGSNLICYYRCLVERKRAIFLLTKEKA